MNSYSIKSNYRWDYKVNWLWQSLNYSDIEWMLKSAINKAIKRSWLINLLINWLINQWIIIAGEWAEKGVKKIYFLHLNYSIIICCFCILSSSFAILSGSGLFYNQVFSCLFIIIICNPVSCCQECMRAWQSSMLTIQKFWLHGQ